MFCSWQWEGEEQQLRIVEKELQNRAKLLLLGNSSSDSLSVEKVLGPIGQGLKELSGKKLRTANGTVYAPRVIMWSLCVRRSTDQADHRLDRG